MATIFNGTKEFAGYFEAFSGGKSAVKIGKAGDVGSGFMVSQYTATAARPVSMQRFMNVEGVVANIGTVQGTVQLTGLIGAKDDFIKLVESSNSGVCGEQLTVEIDASSGFTKCDSISGTEYEGGGGETKIICSGAILSQIQLTGQVTQDGVVLQQGTLVLQFTALEVK